MITPPTPSLTLDELPLWMRHSQRGIDWGAVFALALGILAAWAFIVQPGLPRTNGLEHAVFAAQEMVDSILEGRLYPRWSPHAFNGYGAPIPNFVPPLPTYSAALLRIFVTGNAVDAVRLLIVIAFVCASEAIYAFITRRKTAAHGLLASALYIFSPMMSFIAPHAVGDTAWIVASAGLPTLLWSADRALRGSATGERTRVDFALVTFFTAVLMLTHPVLALAGIALVIGMTLAHPSRIQKAPAIIGTILVGIGLSAFYWLPALAEAEFISWMSNGFIIPNVTWGTLFSPLPAVDLDAMQPLIHWTLGIGGWVFGAAGAVVSGIMIQRGAWKNVRFVFGWLAAAILTGSALLFFPDHPELLIVLTLCAAIVGSGILEAAVWLPIRARYWVISAALLTAFVLAYPAWLAPRWESEFGVVTPQSALQYELDGYGIAAMPAGFAIPAANSMIPSPDRSLIASYSEGVIDKLAGERQSGSAQIGLIANETHFQRFSIETFSSVSLQIATLYFPGWSASLNGAPLSLRPNTETGLIEVEIVGGQRAELTLEFGATSARSTGWILSGAALGILLLTQFWAIPKRTTPGLLASTGRERAWRRLRASTRIDQAQPPDVPSMAVARGRHHEAWIAFSPLTRAENQRCALIVIGMAALLFGIVPRGVLYPPPGSSLDGTTRFRIQSDIGIEAAAFRVVSTVLSDDDVLDFTVYWRAVRPLEQNDQVRAVLIHLPTETRYGQADFHHPGGIPARRWTPGRFITDTVQLSIMDGMPTGQYTLTLEFSDCSNGCETQRRSFYDTDGIVQGETLTLPVVIEIVP